MKRNQGKSTVEQLRDAILDQGRVGRYVEILKAVTTGFLCV